MTKREMAALEKLFTAEIEGALEHQSLGRIVQSTARIFQELAERGLCERESVKLGGRLPVTVSGWVLTYQGRYAYCIGIGA